MNMPKIEPIPIKTKGLPWYKATWVWLKSSRKWEVVEDFYFTLPDGTRVVIPKGFIFDGASIPRIFWAFLSPIGILFIPGLLHDFSYKYNYLIKVKPGGTRIRYKEGAGKKYWDELFRDVANQVNGLKVINSTAYYALLVGGGFAWRGHRRKG